MGMSPLFQQTGHFHRVRMCQSGIFVRDNINHIICCIQAVKVLQSHQRGNRHELDPVQVNQHKMNLFTLSPDQRVPR